MTTEQTLFTTLSDDGDVGPLVVTTSSPVLHRIYVSVAPDNVAKPYIVYTLITARTPNTFNVRTNIEEVTFQIDVYDTTYSSVRALGDHIVDAVDTGMLMSGDPFLNAFYEDDTKLHRMMVDVTVWHSRS